MLIGIKGIESYQKQNPQEASLMLRQLSVADNTLNGRNWEDLTRNEKLAIKQQTGWEFYNKDWKFEISDITLKKDFVRPDNNVKFKLGECIDGKVFEFYPELKNSPVWFEDIEHGDARVNADTGEIIINTNENDKQLRIGILHESQHLIQKKEGWYSGSNRDEFIEEGTSQKKINVIENIDEILRGAEWLQNNRNVDFIKALNYITNRFQDRYSGIEITFAKIIAKQGVDNVRNFLLKNHIGQYLRVAGEVETRNVSEMRINLTEDERRNNLLTDTQDTAEKDKIYKEDNLENNISNNINIFANNKNFQNNGNERNSNAEHSDKSQYHFGRLEGTTTNDREYQQLPGDIRGIEQTKENETGNETVDGRTKEQIEQLLSYKIETNQSNESGDNRGRNVFDSRQNAQSEISTVNQSLQEPSSKFNTATKTLTANQQGSTEKVQLLSLKPRTDSEGTSCIKNKR